jgi:hypothetical protein
MLSVCIDVRPARLVESAAAPSEPMPFELRESGESRRVRGKNRPPAGGCDDMNTVPFELLGTLSLLPPTHIDTRGQEEGEMERRRDE